MPCVKNITDLAVILAQIQSISIADDYARGILTSMLQYQQCIVDHLGNRSLANCSYYSAHINLPGELGLIKS